MDIQSDRTTLIHIFEESLKKADPSLLIQNKFYLNRNILSWNSDSIDLSQYQRIFVFGAGKAAESMSIGLHHILENRIDGGIVICPNPTLEIVGNITFYPGNHPIPGLESIKSTEVLIRALSKTTEHDLIFFLISGGASAMLCKPIEGVTLNDLQSLNEQLIKSGQSIHQINEQRKKVSAIKGGKLLNFTTSRKIVNLLISDVPGDDPSVIGSGPTQPENLIHLQSDSSLKIQIKPVSENIDKNKESILGKIVTNIWINSPGVFAKNVAEYCRSIEPEAKIYLHDAPYTGSTESVCELISTTITEILKMSPQDTLFFIFNGESEVNVKGHGKGGRNQHLALNFLIHELPKYKNLAQLTLLSAGTDGIDGNTDVAGAIIDSDMLERANSLSFDPPKYLNRFDSYNYFNPIGASIKTGPTQNNLMDIQLVLVRPKIN